MSCLFREEPEAESGTEVGRLRCWKAPNDQTPISLSSLEKLGERFDQRHPAVPELTYFFGQRVHV